MKVCPKCFTKHEKNGVFCSRVCANSRIWSKKDRKIKSLALIGRKRKATRYGNHTDETKTKMIETRKVKENDRFLLGEISSRKALRQKLIVRDGCECSICKINEWQNKPITLQVDHVDGNAGNNAPDNLRLLCPMCHSQTPFYAGRNRGNGRKSRGIPVY
jgi:5-methylcytosine-specific restriction endonuclease McrA